MMDPITRSTRTSRRLRAALFTVVAASLTAATANVAHAHFLLMEPPSYAAQDVVGNPQKNPPCGQFDEIQGPTGVVTTFEEGSTFEVTISERIYHPGHYRVAIAETPDALPDPPPVTAGDTPCGSTIIDPDPALPVLADGALVHDSPFSGDQTFEVELPEGFTCEDCTLQVIQFMSDHALNNPGGCYYHHCATVSVVASDAGDVGRADAGEDAGDDAGSSDAGTDDVGEPDTSAPDTDMGDDAADNDTSATDDTSGTDDTSIEGEVSADGAVGDTDDGPGPDESSGSSGGCQIAAAPGSAAPIWMAAMGLMGLTLGRRERG